jgi:GTPase SAR1 family protein
MDNEDRDPLREELKEKCQRFRILIIGRANAGKSTILKRICDTTEEPEILDSEGNEVMHNNQTIMNSHSNMNRSIRPSSLLPER